MVITVSASGGSTLTIRLATSASNLPQTQTFSSAQCFQTEYVCSKGLKDAKAASLKELLVANIAQINDQNLVF
jgi:hypothetical protein